MHTRRPPARQELSHSTNRLLGGLPPDELRRILPTLPTVPLHRDQVLLAPQRPADHVYFPDGGLCVIAVTTADGQTAAAACIGNEGAVGLTAWGAASGTAHRALVAVPWNSAHVMGRGAFDREMEHRGALSAIIETYTRRFMESCCSRSPVTRCIRWRPAAHAACWRSPTGSTGWICR